MMLLSSSLRGEINPFIFGPELVNFCTVFIRDTRAEEPSIVVSLDDRVGIFLGFLNTKYFNAINFSPIIDDSTFGGLTDPTYIKSTKFRTQTRGKLEWGSREGGRVMSKIGKIKRRFPLIVMVTVGSSKCFKTCISG